MLRNYGNVQLTICLTTIMIYNNIVTEFNLTTKEIYSVVDKYRAEYENACDDIYYGYGYKFWLINEQNNGSKMSDVDAKIIWSASFSKMSRD